MAGSGKGPHFDGRYGRAVRPRAFGRYWPFYDMARDAHAGRFWPGSGHPCAGPSSLAGPRRRAANRVVEQSQYRGSLHTMAIYQLGDHVPVIPASCYIAPEATAIGSVTLGERVTVLSGAVVRGDNEPVVIGDDTNIQENCVLHTDLGSPLALAKGGTVGDRVL